MNNGHSTWCAGQVILNDYLVEKELGRGGMGQVWLVKSNSTGRRFAVKQTLLREARHRKAFLAELQTWIDLPEHPNIVPCRFFRTVGEEIVIFADYVEGGSLADWISNRKLTTLEHILDVAIQSAWGLHAIHEHGYIHQDVKPGNILMTADGVPMVADFGLARARMFTLDGNFISPAMSSGQQSILVSACGMTPAYASPEQRTGKSISRKTDIWSWGVCVLDMFTGGVSCPHGGHIAAEVLKELWENDQQDNGLPGMPREIYDMLKACFESNPENRLDDLQSISRLMMEIYKSITGRVYERKMYSTSLPSGKAIPHDRIGILGTWRDPRDWLREAYLAIGRDLKEANSIKIPPAQGPKGTGVADLAVYEEAERIFMEAIQGGTTGIVEQVAKLSMDKAAIYMSLGDSVGALNAYEKCIEIYRHLVESEGREELSPQWAMALMNKALALFTMGERQEAVELYSECIEIQEYILGNKGGDENAIDLAGTLINKANALASMGDLRGAIRCYEESIDIWRRLVGQEGRECLANDLALALMNKAISLDMLGDREGVIDLYDESIEIWRYLMGEKGRWDLADNLAKAFLNKGNTLDALGKHSDAVSNYDLCIAIRRRLIERAGRRELVNDLATALMNKADALWHLKNTAESIQLHDESIAMRRALVEREGRRELANDLALALTNKARVLKAIGNIHEAVSLYDQSIEIWDRLINQEGRNELENNLAIGYMNKGDAMAALGDKASAISQIDRAINIWDRLVNIDGRCDLSRKLELAYQVQDRVSRGTWS